MPGKVVFNTCRGWANGRSRSTGNHYLCHEKWKANFKAKNPGVVKEIRVKEGAIIDAHQLFNHYRNK